MNYKLINRISKWFILVLVLALLPFGAVSLTLALTSLVKILMGDFSLPVLGTFFEGGILSLIICYAFKDLTNQYFLF